jgi:phospholipase C
MYDLLARQFAVCDHWFASMPTDTWPNRLFALAGTSGGLINTPSTNEVKEVPPGYDLTSIFEVLQNQNVDWGYYFTDAPFALVFERIAQDATLTSRMRRLDAFYDRAATGDLPAVTWLDPNFSDVPDDPDRANDDHPPGDIARGQALVAEIYAHLIASPAWPKTLFIIVYDEHGGFYDHERPPTAVEDPPTTATYGVRVPAFLVTPYVPAASVSAQPYDHTSLLATILRRFCRQADGQVPDMGPRVKVAADVGSALTATPASFGAPTPPTLPPGFAVPTPPTDRVSFGTVLHTALFGF